MKKELNLKIELSQEAIDLLKYIDENGYAEYRDGEYETVEDFLKSDTHLVNNRTLEWFLNRNSNGTYHLTNELLEYYLIDMGDGMAWHTTYYITRLGKKLITENNI